MAHITCYITLFWKQYHSTIKFNLLVQWPYHIQVKNTCSYEGISVDRNLNNHFILDKFQHLTPPTLFMFCGILTFRDHRKLSGLERRWAWTHLVIRCYPSQDLDSFVANSGTVKSAIWVPAPPLTRYLILVQTVLSLNLSCLLCKMWETTRRFTL